MGRFIIAWFIMMALPMATAAEGANPAMPGAGCPLSVLGVQIKAQDVMVTQKDGYIHVLVDIHPYQDVLASPSPSDLQTLALSAARDCAAARNVGVSRVKVDIVAFTERDSYGAPVWSSVHLYGKFEFTKKRGAWKPAANAPTN